ncbi:MAG TPA: hypothetical protein VF691_03915 [Cytophagaceae bacterium]|jgi:hypothetical protein
MKSFFLAFILLLSYPSFSHEGHNDAPAANAGNLSKGYFSIAAYSNIYELVLRYEPIEKGKNAVMKLFVSDFATNKPIDSAKIVIQSPENTALKFAVKRLEPGIYAVEGTFPEDQSYSLAVNISSGNQADLLLLKGIAVGHKLEAEGEGEQGNPLFTKNSIILLLVGLLLGALVSYLVVKKNKR